jgi:uncharacterized protein
VTQLNASVPDADLSEVSDPLSPGLYLGRVSHARFGRTAHAFHYPLAMQLVDVDTLPALNQGLRLLGYNRLRPFALLDRDHFTDRDRSIAENVRAFLRNADECLSEGADRIFLLTQSRVLGYVFNPISLFYCVDKAGAMVAVVAEVHNTFGQRHAYLLRHEAGGDYAGREKKVFHVSPFLTLEGTYHFRLSRPASRMSVGIDLYREGVLLFASRMTLRRQPLTDRALLKLLARYPLGSRGVIAAIHWEGMKLIRKGARYNPVPAYEPETARRGVA